MIKITYIILLFIILPIAGKAFDDSEFDEFDQKPLNIDPFEKTNRKIFNFNLTIDRNIVRPMAIKYKNSTTEDFRLKIKNLLNNSTIPGDIFIAGSQADIQGGGILLMRFVINTTIGLFGIFDIADELGIKAIDKRFSDTLAIYGLPSGDYIVLPLLGPSSVRGAFDLPTDIALNANFWHPEVLPLSYANFSKNGLYAAEINKPIFGASLFPFKAFNVRIDILPITDDLDMNSVDLYYAYRDMYLQYDKYKREQRIHLINNGYFSKTNSRAMNVNELSKSYDNNRNLGAEIF